MMQKYIRMCVIGSIIILCLSTVFAHEEQDNDAGITLIEENHDNKADVYTEFFKATYYHAKHNVHASIKSFEKILSKPHSIYVYDGYLRLLFDTGQFHRIAQLEKDHGKEFTQKFNDNLEIKLIRAQAFLHTGDDEKAETLFLDLQEQYPDDPQVAYYSALSYIKNNKFEKAITFLDDCLKKVTLRDKHFLFYFLKSKIYLQIHKYAQATQAIEKSLELFPKFDKGWLFKSILLEQQGKISEAISGYKNFLDLVGRDISVEKQLVQLLFSQQRFEEAADYLKKIKSDRPEYFLDRALIEFRAQNYDDALVNINKVLEKAPQFDKAKLLKIDILLGDEQVDEALSCITVWIKQQPSNYALLHTLLLLRKEHIDKETIIAILKDIKEERSSVPLLAALADMYLENQDYQEGVAQYKELLSIVNDKRLRSKVFYQIGYVYFVQKDYDNLERILEEAIKQPPVYVSVYNLFAYYYAQKNKKLKQALVFIDKALRLAPDRYDYVDTKGYLLFKLGKKTDALKYLRKAHKLSPHDETIKQHLREAEGPDDDEDSEQE